MKVVNDMTELEKRKRGSGLKAIPFPVLAFFISLFFVWIAFIKSNIAPIGEHSILISDLKAQYAPYLLLFRRHLKELDFGNLLSSFSYEKGLGAGKNFMSTFGYYMASPFDLITFLFPEHLIGIAMALIISLKLSFASAFMCIFLEKRTFKRNPMALLFAVTYAFTSYTVVYLFNVIWFDGYALLPLLLYLIERFMEERKQLGLVIALLVLFISNFYAAYMVGVFCFFYIVGRYVHKVFIDKDIKGKEAVRSVIRFVLLAVLTIMVSGIMILPVGLDVLRNKDVLVNVKDSDVIGFKTIDLVDRIFYGIVGGFDTLTENLPFFFISLSVTLLIAIFFASKIFPRSKKIFYAVILLLIFASFNITKLDIMWQAFDEPNWFCHRFSFVFMPVFYIIAINTFEKIKEIENRDMLKAFGALIALLIVAQSFGNLSTDGSLFLMNIGLMSAYLLLFMGLKVKKWPEQLKNSGKLVGKFLVVFIIFETALMAPLSAKDLSSYSSGTVEEVFEDDYNALVSLKGQFGSNGRRADMEDVLVPSGTEFGSGYMVQAAVGTNGISIFDSNSNKNLGRFMKQLGLNVNHNYFATGYGYSASSVDAFFSIGNAITFSDKSNGTLIAKAGKDDKYQLYDEGEVLDIGFAASMDALDFDFFQLETKSYGKDYMGFQNKWYNSLFPEAFTEDFFISRTATDENVTFYNASSLPIDKVAVTLSKDEYTSDTLGQEGSNIAYQARNAKYRNGSMAPITAVIKFKAPKSGEQYFGISVVRTTDIMSVLKDKQLMRYYYPNTNYSPLLRLGYYEEGQEVEVAISSDSDVFSYLDFFYGTFDEAKFREQFAKIDNNVTCDAYENGYVAFTTDLKEGEMLLTTIPLEDGWTCYIDGQRAGMLSYHDAFIAADPGTGSHKVEFRYTAPGLKIGMIVSVIGVLSLAIVLVHDAGKRSKKK